MTSAYLRITGEPRCSHPVMDSLVSSRRRHPRLLYRLPLTRRNPQPRPTPFRHGRPPSTSSAAGQSAKAGQPGWRSVTAADGRVSTATSWSTHWPRTPGAPSGTSGRRSHARPWSSSAGPASPPAGDRRHVPPATGYDSREHPRHRTRRPPRTNRHAATDNPGIPPRHSRAPRPQARLTRRRRARAEVSAHDRLARLRRRLSPLISRGHPPSGPRWGPERRDHRDSRTALS